jgi:hypothetical protein
MGWTAWACRLFLGHDIDRDRFRPSGEEMTSIDGDVYAIMERSCRRCGGWVSDRTGEIRWS